MVEFLLYGNVACSLGMLFFTTALFVMPETHFCSELSFHLSLLQLYRTLIGHNFIQETPVKSKGSTVRDCDLFTFFR